MEIFLIEQGPYSYGPFLSFIRVSYNEPMDFALVYIVNRFLYRVADFFHHWYFHASRVLARAFISFLERLDRTFAIKITLQHFFEPLYKDYTFLGRILGMVFRSGRILIGGAVYLFIAVVFFIVYVMWLLVPLVLIIYAASHLF